MSKTLMSTYKRLPVTFARGEGVWLWDTDGKQYLDALSGIAVCSLGHANAKVADAICNQSRQLLHTSNLYGISNQQQLGEKLCHLAKMDKVFFSNSGAEANEAAIKLARLYGHSKGIDIPTIIVADNSFHGRTMATLTATGNKNAQLGFEPLLQGFVRVPFDDIAAIEKVAADNQNIVAVLVEPIQGEGGIHIPAADYLDKIRSLCDQHDWLMMLDEIQTGICRTGKWFAYQHSNATPDVITSAKALGNGMPIGACLARGKAAEVLQPGTHGSTFGGNPLACAAGLAVINEMERLDLAANAMIKGERLVQGLKTALHGNPRVVEIRAQGLMIGIELHQPCTELVQLALDMRLLINVTAGKVIRLLPPLVIDTAEIEQIIDSIATLVKHIK
ncbi:MAG TPA: aspartate aminotransferase family protein [Candidatus Tenderia electrophaga]|uniref:Acetylornithine aminotransferase n=1 Tax=Candidatus Tenderia electrophaga TaxID=1748243 RepID=A0A832J6C9_9GAMM|nr:aspartate aminotransferase family protein [Candidatus Tenderia electrophaga]